MKYQLHTWTRGRYTTWIISSFSDHFLNKPIALSRDLLAQVLVLVTIEINDAINNCLIGPGINAQRVIAPQNKVGVFANFNASHFIIYMQSLCRIESDHLECLVFRQAAVFYALCCFLVQSAILFRGFRVGTNLARFLYYNC